MHKLLEEELLKKYPKILAEMYTPGCMGSGISCGDGWYFLLDVLYFMIQRRIDRRTYSVANKYTHEEKEIPQVVCKQVKEKFGQLRNYYDGGDDTISAWVDIVEHMSSHVCEECGGHNEYVGTTKNGWIKTLCTTCAKKQNRNLGLREDLINIFRKKSEAEQPKKSISEQFELVFSSDT